MPALASGNGAGLDEEEVLTGRSYGSDSPPERQAYREFDEACSAVLLAELDAWEHAVAVGAELVAEGALDAGPVADRLFGLAAAIDLIPFYEVDSVQLGIASAFMDAGAALDEEVPA